MRSARYVFVGDRFPVLNRMLALGLSVTDIFCARDFFHGEKLADPARATIAIDDRNSLVKALSERTFDVLVSNGCPYILPVSELKKTEQHFVNIHASLLPDFPGPHPINAAMLAGRDAGATCHHMQDTVDSGAIISQARIPYSADMDLGLCYLLTLRAEADSFEHALARDFAADPHYKNNALADGHFKRTQESMRIDFSRDGEAMFRHIRAFGIFSQGATFTHKGSNFTVFDAEPCANPYLCAKNGDYRENEIAFIYDGTLVIKKGNAFLKLKNVRTNDRPTLAVGDVLG